MNNEAVNSALPDRGFGRAPASQWRVVYGRRLVRAGAEAGYDAAAWVTGLLVAAWAIRDVPASAVRWLPACLGVAAIGALSVASGLLAGLYRGRYQRGSLDEVVNVGWPAA